MKKKAMLIVLDGYGEGKDYKYNAVTRSKTPFLDKLRKSYPTTVLNCDSEHVGLPKNTMGGSEVGHFTMGAGRIVYQSLEEINRSIKKGEFFKKKALKKAAQICHKNDSALHLLGMISDQGVHSHLSHLFTLLKWAKKEKLKKVYIHAITDGRDVKERSAKKFITAINKEIKKLKIGKIVDIVGRYYAMDRDKNYNRTQQAYNLYTEAKGIPEKTALSAIDNEYKRGTETDYYIKPIVLDPEGTIQKKDAVIFFNYRTDRAKQITQAFTEKQFKGFKRKISPLPYFVCFGPYSKIAPVLYEANKVKNNLGSYLSAKGKTQLRIAETEKYAHVTFFFNSQDKEPYKGEKQILIPSPKCASYAEKPEMSASKATNTLIKEMKSRPDKQDYDFILFNFANCDLVGHSGDFKATVKAVETVDKCLAKLIPVALKQNYKILITADHGNADFMKYPNGDDCPAHTLNPVICIYLGNDHKLRKGKTLGLKDIAPTILDLLDLKPPKEMTGGSLLL